jgi:cyclic pyranopterin monophosphate synthase
MTTEAQSDGPRLTHVDPSGQARMVDVSGKEITERRARAQAVVRISAEADRLLREGRLPKGNAFEMVRFAAIQAAKQTAQLLPLCHPLRLTTVDAELTALGGGAWRVASEVVALDRTGVEMEALAAATVGALALYDMVKAVDRAAEIGPVHLLEKSGGRSGRYVRDGGGAK